MATNPPITHLLEAWKEGDGYARDALFQIIYEDLHELALQQRRNWRGNNTVRASDLVNELYLRFSKKSRMQVRDRGHFFTLAAKAMRQILVNYAKGKKRKKRGGDWQQVTLGTGEEPAGQFVQQIDNFLDLDDALTELAAYNERYVKVVELSYFGGLTYDEIAEALGITKRTVTRDMAKALPLLRRLMKGDGSRDEGRGSS